MRILMVVAQHDFRDEEYKEPRQLFEGAGHEVKVASERAGDARGKLGSVIFADYSLHNVIIQDYDALVLVGGAGMMELWFDDRLIRIVQDALKEDMVIGAICIAPVVLANAGILNGKKATVSEGSANRLKEKGAEYINQEVVLDGKIITANGPEASREFGEKIVEILKNEPA